MMRAHAAGAAAARTSARSSAGPGRRGKPLTLNASNA
jgi:hypothetical protein